MSFLSVSVLSGFTKFDKNAKAIVKGVFIAMASNFLFCISDILVKKSYKDDLKDTCLSCIACCSADLCLDVCTKFAKSGEALPPPAGFLSLVDCRKRSWWIVGTQITVRPHCGIDVNHGTMTS